MTTSMEDKLNSQEATPRKSMNSAQWVIALVVLVVLVFGISFIIQSSNLGGGGSNPAPREPAPQLTWATDHFPPGMPQEDKPAAWDWFPLQLEPRQARFHDFWFENTNPQDVRLGMNPTCKCSSLEVYILPEAAMNDVTQARSALAALNDYKPLSNLAALTPFADAVPGLRKQCAQARMLTLTQSDPVTIPAGSVGWVRYKWKGQEASLKSTTLKATLWTSAVDKEVQAPCNLTVAIHYRHLLRTFEALPEKDDAWYFHNLGRMSDGTLYKLLGGENGLSPTEKPEDEYLVVWSPILSDPKIERNIVGSAANFLEIGEPERLSDEECAKLANSLDNLAKSMKPPRPELRDVVRSAFKIKVTIRTKGEAGETPIDYGRFRRRVRLNVKDYPDDYVDQIVEGRVNGPLQVKRGIQPVESLDFLNFPSEAGSGTKEVSVQLDPNLTLTVDKKPEFLKVTLKKAPNPTPTWFAPSTWFLPGQWILQVGVEKNGVKGRFPDESDPNLSDCAIYLRPGKSEIRYRLPVVGSAL